ncbi:hypothetical protein TNCV_4706572 [Trichonephila clavipes]|nr:hypothetical protein TNCV_4706572 [Trichonephila clavipes]
MSSCSESSQGAQHDSRNQGYLNNVEASKFKCEEKILTNQCCGETGYATFLVQSCRVENGTRPPPAPRPQSNWTTSYDVPAHTVYLVACFDLILLQLLKTFHSTRVIIEFDAVKVSER